MPNVHILIKRLDPELGIPKYANPGDAGVDLQTAVDFVLAPGERKVVPTGVALAIEYGYVGLVHPRSGLAAKQGITVVNAPGTIDSGYRGEIRVCLLNTDQSSPAEFKKGDRIAQIVFQKFEEVQFDEVDELPGTFRGKLGFGSTGR
ncbi:MAG: dUTP diphosphatase [Candidatus Ancillula sp.]|jgi:dUTP pyrophosphatase|nr:dUTP diphosphatase [Candidatus Ancillula sp.]